MATGLHRLSASAATDNQTSLQIPRAWQKEAEGPRAASEYRADIDGLRAIAVLLVVGYHAYPGRVPGGFIGVDVFFVISGFLITGIILHEAKDERFSFVRFYLRRCRRILPALALVLLGTWLIGFATLTGPEFQNLGSHVLAGSTFTSNFLLLRETGYFDGPGGYKPLLHLWSLAVEEQYYLFWPLILMLLWRRPNAALPMVVILLVLSFGLNVMSKPEFSFYMLPSRFWELLTGAGLAFAFATGRRDTESSARTGQGPNSEVIGQSCPFRTALGCVGLALIIGAAFLLDSSHPYPGWRALAPVAGTALLIFAGPASWLNSRLLSYRWVVLIGLISYPLYLWHWPMFSVLNIVQAQIGPSPSSLKWIKLALIGFSILLAYLTYRLVEIPVKRKIGRYGRNRETSMRAIALLLGVLLIAGVVGGLTASANGFMFRHQVFDRDNFELHSQEISRQFFDQDLARFPPCQGVYKVLADSTWCYQATTARPNIAVIGDSHARSLFPGLADALEKRRVGNLLLIGRCPALLDVKVRNSNSKDECLDLNGRIIKLVASDPFIHTVVLVSRGPLYSTGTGFGPAELEVGQVLEPASDGDNRNATMDSLFFSGYERTIRALGASGKRVIFAVDVPELGFPPAECLYSRPYQRSASSLRVPCAIGSDEVRARQTGYREIVTKLSKENPELRVFDAAALLCDGKLCHAEREGKFLYSDSNHLGVYGSRLVGEGLAEFMSKIHQ